MIEALFVILLTFVADSHGSATKTLKCENLRCVNIIIENASRESTTLRRLRVFRADQFGGTFPLGNTAFPPILDVTYD